MRSVSKDLVSIIIPNHGRDLTELAKSRCATPYVNIETIVIDEGKERAAQRNIGVERSRGEYLFFVDSDMSFDRRLIADCVGLMKTYDGLYIPEIIVDHPVKTYFRQFYTGTNIDAIRFIKRSFWQPFDEALTGVEDWDWDRRFKGSKGVASFHLYHHAKSNWRRKLYYSKWIPEYRRRYPNCPELSVMYRLGLIGRGIWNKVRTKY